ncbi:hypothetical protein ig2599ANME_0676 [groundwater metagenome]
MTVCGFREAEPQINADERRYKPATDFCAAHRKVRKDRKVQPQCGTQMPQIQQIFTDPRVSASSAQSAFHHVCPSLKNPASGTSVSTLRASKHKKESTTNRTFGGK